MAEMTVGESLRILREHGIQTSEIRRLRWKDVHFSTMIEEARVGDKRFEGRRGTRIKNALRAIYTWTTPEDPARDVFLGACQGARREAMPPWMIDQVRALAGDHRIQNANLDCACRFTLDVLRAVGEWQTQISPAEAWAQGLRILRLLCGEARRPDDTSAIAAYAGWASVNPTAVPLRTKEFRGWSGGTRGGGRPAIGTRSDDALLMQLQHQWTVTTKESGKKTPRQIARDAHFVRAMIEHLLIEEGDGPYSAPVVDEAYDSAPRRREGAEAWQTFAAFVATRAQIVLPKPATEKRHRALAVVKLEVEELPPEAGEPHDDLPPEL